MANEFLLNDGQQSGDGSNYAHILRKIIANVLRCGRHAAGEGNAKRKEQHRKGERRQSDMELRRATNGMHDEISLRIGQQEKADPGSPQDPPSHIVSAIAIREPAANCPQQHPLEARNMQPGARLAQCSIHTPAQSIVASIPTAP